MEMAKTGNRKLRLILESASSRVSMTRSADDVGDHKFPVSFTRSTFMKISARLAVEPAGAFGTGTLVVGDALSEPSSQSFSFEGAATLMGTELVITDVPADVPLASNVDFMDPLRIN